MGDIALHVPGAEDSSAVLTFASRGATTAGGELLGNVEALVALLQGRSRDGASLESAGAKGSGASLQTRSTTVVGVVVRGLGGRRRRAGRSGGVALQVVGVPLPALRALRRRLVGGRLVGNTAALARVPVPAARRALVTRRRGRRRSGGTTVRQAALLLSEPRIQLR